MTALDFFALVMAASAIVDVWRNGSIFAELRAYFEARQDAGPPLADDPVPTEESLPADPNPWWMRLFDAVLPRWFAELVSCRFCLSHHTPWVAAVVCYLPTLFVTTPWMIFLLKLPVYSLAATRIGNIINACVPASAQYDRAAQRSGNLVTEDSK